MAFFLNFMHIHKNALNRNFSNKKHNFGTLIVFCDYTSQSITAFG
jgi:hypothetical protein